MVEIIMISVILSYIPVSYTHLDVYKRQGPGRLSIISGNLIDGESVRALI